MLPRHTRILFFLHIFTMAEVVSVNDTAWKLVTESAMSSDGLNIHTQEELNV